MRKIARSAPFLLILWYIGFLATNNWETMNYIKLMGLSFIILLILYFLFISLTEKYIDFLNGFKIKKYKIKKNKYANKKIGYLFDFVYLITLVLFVAWFYSIVILEDPLNYLLNLVIGLAVLNLILEKVLTIKTNENE